MQITNHRLEGIDLLNSPNQSDVITPDTIIIHYTGSSTAQSAINTFMDAENEVSAHIIVGLDGALTQLVPFNKKAWHAGESRHENRTGLNKYSIGIEVVNAGRLSKSGTKYYSWFEKAYNTEDVIKAVHRNEDIATYWQRYTESQIETVAELCELLTRQYNILHILGHEEVSPGRKIDPGPAFPLDKLRNRILKLDDRSLETDVEAYDIPKEGYVTASKLNIRSGPSSARMKIANPLLNGKKVKIIQKEEGWYKVATTIEGWVSSAYIRQA